ncbi:acyl-CoA thioester hydrolase [Roseibium hamelinense]|uniref:Acyl-CoA thioester hydrolase n=1 Tax=Roseibium hamelinense TaxID=150831 RepID=A0A562TG83_9HYPH|nr:thioesterase family protein [Roseibium hamelinense]MTI42374.1 acyl-CoA thioesterase [Roseibium hamelinense]TWI92579.1 acyl-CoA thioester hydrolase [Roseibium hamelinense]
MTAASEKPARPTPLARGHFRAFRKIPTRWMDVDIYGHVNNVQYLSFFDTAVNGWYIDKGLLDPRSSQQIFLVVETGCNYFAELVYPETVEAGLLIEKIGSSSVTYRVGLFREGHGNTAAHGRFVHVLVDRQTRRPTPIPAHFKAAFDELSSSREKP